MQYLAGQQFVLNDGCPINDSFTALQAVVNNSRNKIYIILFVSLGILLVGVLGWKVSNTIEKDNIIQIGKVIQDCEEVYPFKEGLALVCQNGKYGFISKKGEMVIPCQYEDALFFSDGIAIVCQEGQYGAINKIGEMIIPFQYDYGLKTFDCLVILNQNEDRISCSHVIRECPLIIQLLPAFQKGWLKSFQIAIMVLLIQKGIR